MNWLLAYRHAMCPPDKVLACKVSRDQNPGWARWVSLSISISPFLLIISVVGVHAIRNIQQVGTYLSVSLMHISPTHFDLSTEHCIWCTDIIIFGTQLRWSFLCTMRVLIYPDFSCSGRTIGTWVGGPLFKVRHRHSPSLFPNSLTSAILRNFPLLFCLTSI